MCILAKVSRTTRLKKIDDSPEQEMWNECQHNFFSLCVTHPLSHPHANTTQKQAHVWYLQCIHAYYTIMITWKRKVSEYEKHKRKIIKLLPKIYLGCSMSCDTTFILCSSKFTFLRLIWSSVSVETSHLIFRLLFYPGPFHFSVRTFHFYCNFCIIPLILINIRIYIN